MRAGRLCAVLLLAVGCTHLARAAQGACGTPEAFAASEAAIKAARGYDEALKFDRRCLGDPVSDVHPLVVAFNKATPDTDTAVERSTALIAALSRLRDAAAQRAGQGVDTLAWQQIASELEAELQATRKSAQQGSFIHAIDPAFWSLPPVDSGTVANGAINPVVTGCAMPPAACPAFESRADVIRILRLMTRLIGYADYPALQKHFEQARLMDARWQGYFNQALPQFWWEVAINGRRMGDALCPKDASGMQIGFCRVPQSQLIVLHPSAALQWVHGADDEDDLAPAFVVEVFGRNSWHWNENDTTLHGQFGWSVIAAYSNPAGDTDHWTYGLMLHKGPRLNLGVTSGGGGQYSLLVSVALAQKAFTKRQQYLDYLKALQKDSWESLL